MNKLLLLIKVSRPAFWGAGVLAYFLGFAVSGGELSWLLVGQALLLTIPSGLVIFGVNDVYDYESDLRNPRKPSSEGFLLRKEHHSFVLKAAFVSAVVLLVYSLLASVVLGNFTNLFATALIVALSYAYSAKPLRLKAKPPLDSFCNAAGVWGLILLGFSHNGALPQFPIKIYYACLGVMGMHAFTTIMDYSADKAAGIKTFAVKFGKRAAALFASLTCVLILLFSGIKSDVLRGLTFFALALALLATLKPGEAFARKLFRTFFLVGLITLFVYVYQLMSDVTLFYK